MRKGSEKCMFIVKGFFFCRRFRGRAGVRSLITLLGQIRSAEQ